MLNVQLVVACSNLKIRKYNKLTGVHAMDGLLESFTFLNAPKAEQKFQELVGQRKNVWWFYCPAEGGTVYTTTPIFKQWKEHLEAERVIEYNKQAVQQIVAGNTSSPIGIVTFDPEDWYSLVGRDKYAEDVFTSQPQTWLRDTELDMFRYKLDKVYYLRIADTPEYQFINPNELKALGYDFDSLYQPEQAT